MRVHDAALILMSVALAAHNSHAQAQTADWTSLQTAKHGATLIVETGVAAYGPASFDRCRLVSVDAATLTCTALSLNHRKARLVFPASRIDAVFQLKRRWADPRAIFTLGVAGTLLGGLIATNPVAIAVGIAGILVCAMMDEADRSVQAYNEWNGIQADPFPQGERHELLYLRPAEPAPYPSTR